MQMTQYIKNCLMPALVFPVIILSGCAIIATFTPPAHAQSAATGIATEAARGSKTARLSVDALCAQLMLDEVTAIMGKNFARGRPDTEQLFQECKYGDSKDKQRVRYFSLGSNILKEASWRKMVESGGKGKVIERDGVLVGHSRHSRGKGFGDLDDIWFKDRILLNDRADRISEDFFEVPEI